MKILHFVHNFLPEFRGGTESYVFNLSMRQIRTGNLVRVVSGSAMENSIVDRRLEYYGPVHVTRLFKRRNEEQYKIWSHFPRMEQEALEILRSYDPDIVHIHHWHHLTDSLIRLAVSNRYPVILTLHDFFSICPRFFRFKPGGSSICPSEQSPGECYTCIREEHSPWPMELVDALYQRRASMSKEVEAASFVYTFSKAVADFFREIPWFPYVPIEVLPIGLLRPLYRSGARTEAVPLKIANWGGQSEVKGTHLLLQAVSLPQLKGKVEVNILGRIVDKEYQELLNGIAEECGAVFHGYFPESEKENLGRQFDLAVFPTQAFETYSIVVDEALSMGFPVITTRPGAQCERVGEAGRIVPSGDVEALADAIQEFLDPSVRLKAVAASAHIRINTMDMHWMRLSRIYDDLVIASPRGKPKHDRRRSYVRSLASQGRARPDTMIQRTKAWGLRRRKDKGGVSGRARPRSLRCKSSFSRLGP